MKILFLSDTHGHHNQIQIDADTDMIIHAGDASNSKDLIENVSEMKDFLDWFEKLQVKYKVFVAGNHDRSIESKLINIKKEYKTITYLEHETLVINGLKIFGSPYTKEFGTNWAFNVKEDVLSDLWDNIEQNTDIIITHSPPKGILDLATKYSKDENGVRYFEKKVYEYCGCIKLKNKILEIKPKYHIFGHIHNNDVNINAGYRIISGHSTIFINGTCVTDNIISKDLTSQGLYFNN